MSGLIVWIKNQPLNSICLEFKHVASNIINTSFEAACNKFCRVVCDFYYSEDSWLTGMNSLKFVLVIQIIQNRISSRKFKPLLKKVKFSYIIIIPRSNCCFHFVILSELSLLKSIYTCLYSFIFYISGKYFIIKFIIFIVKSVHLKFPYDFCLCN